MSAPQMRFPYVSPKNVIAPQAATTKTSGAMPTPTSASDVA